MLIVFVIYLCFLPVAVLWGSSDVFCKRIQTGKSAQMIALMESKLWEALDENLETKVA